MLSGATDLETRPEPEDMKEPMRWLLRGFAGPGSGPHRAAPARTSTSCCPPPTASPRRPSRAAAPAATPSRARLSAALPAPRALAVSRLSYSALEAYRRCSYRFYLERALRLPRVDPPFADDPLPERGLGALLRGTLVHELLERARLRPAARAGRGRGRRADRVARGDRATRGGGRPARHGRALRGLRALRAASRGAAPRAHRAAVRLHARRRREPAGAACSSTASWTCTPPRTGPAGRRLQERRPRRARPGRADRRRPTRPSGSSTRWPGCAAAPSGSRSCTATSSARTSPAAAVYAAADADRLEAELLELAARGGRGPLRAHRGAAPRALRRLPRAGRALLLGEEHTLSSPAAFPSGPAPTLRPDRCANPRRARAHASLLHRAPGSDQGRRRERRPRSPPPAARRGRARMGRRDPRRRAAGALRQGRRRARRRRPVDPRRVARVARGRPADRQQGVPARRLRRASASTAARRCGSPPASRARTPSRPGSARSRRSTRCCPGSRTSACCSSPPRRWSCIAGTAWAATTSRLQTVASRRPRSLAC